MRQDEHTSQLRQSFGSVADDYSRFRPVPPDDVVASLLSPGATDVLELGAGTGALTQQLVRQVTHVRAVEPDARMRQVLTERVPQAEVMAGQAEAIPAADGSADVVIAASAWHWVDEARAVPEVARVLRSGGWLSLLWCGVDRSVDWMRNAWAGGMDLTPDQTAALDERRHVRHVVNLGDGQPFTEPERWVTQWTRPMSKDDLIGLAATYSAVITMDDATRQGHLGAMRRYLNEHPVLGGQDIIDVPMRCLCWRTTRT